jgi:hypothetical protein
VHRAVPTRHRAWLKIPRILGVVERLVIFGGVMFVLLWLASGPNFPEQLKTRTSAIPGAVGDQCPLTYGELVAGGVPLTTIPGWPFDDSPSSCRVPRF